MEIGGWSRDTAWKQGSVIPTQLSASLGLTERDSGSKLGILISHDCDIAEDNLENEPEVEVIVGDLIENPSPNHTHAKSPNRLHLAILIDGERKFVELSANKKARIKKTAIGSQKPDSRFSLDERGLVVLQNWLALRYMRAAFPDSLNKHLNMLRDTLQRIGKRNPEAIVGFYIYYDPDEEISNPEEPYEIWIAVVYRHDIAGADGFAREAAGKITERFELKFKTGGQWRSVELRECKAVSDQTFSLYDAVTYKAYPLEYISLRSAENEN